MSKIGKTIDSSSQYTIDINIDNKENTNFLKEKLARTILKKKYGNIIEKIFLEKGNVSHKQKNFLYKSFKEEKKTLSSKNISDINNYKDYLLKHPNTSLKAENFFSRYNEKKINDLRKDFLGLKKESKKIEFEKRKQYGKENEEKDKNKNLSNYTKNLSNNFNRLGKAIKRYEKILDKSNKNKKNKIFDIFDKFKIPSYYRRYGVSRFIAPTITGSAVSILMASLYKSISDSKRETWLSEITGKKNRPLNRAMNNVLIKRMMKAGSSYDQAINSIYMISDALNDPEKLKQLMNTTLTPLSPFMSIQGVLEAFKNNTNQIAQQRIRNNFGFDITRGQYGNITQEEIEEAKKLVKEQEKTTESLREINILWKRFSEKGITLLGSIAGGANEILDYFSKDNKDKEEWKENQLLTEPLRRIEMIARDKSTFVRPGKNFWSPPEKYVDEDLYHKYLQQEMANYIKGNLGISTNKNTENKNSIETVSQNIEINFNVEQLNDIANILSNIQKNPEFLNKYSQNNDNNIILREILSKISKTSYQSNNLGN